jgi:hypothetical protein
MCTNTEPDSWPHGVQEIIHETDFQIVSPFLTCKYFPSLLFCKSSFNTSVMVQVTLVIWKEFSGRRTEVRLFTSHIVDVTFLQLQKC